MDEHGFHNSRERVNDHENSQSQNDEGKGFDNKGMRNDGAGLKSYNKREQIDCERNDPKQRDSRSIGRNMESDRKQKAGGHRRKSYECQPVSPGGCRNFVAA